MSISVIMPVHNGASFIRDAISSIPDVGGDSVQIIVVNDASTDATEQVVRELMQTRNHLHLENLDSNVGPGPARNVGLELAAGDFVGFLDADDLFAAGALEYMQRELARRADVDIVMGRIRVVRGDEFQYGLDSLAGTGATHRCYQVGSVLVRRDVFSRVGNFDASYRHGEDLDWFFRLQECQVKFYLSDRVVLYHRRHAGNMSDHAGEGVGDIADVMHASVQRRRRIAEVRRMPLEEIYYVRPDQLRVHDL